MWGISGQITVTNGQFLLSGTTGRKGMALFCFTLNPPPPSITEHEADELSLSQRHCPCAAQVFYNLLFKMVRTNNRTVSFVSQLPNISNAISVDSEFVLEGLWNPFFAPLSFSLLPLSLLFTFLQSIPSILVPPSTHRPTPLIYFVLLPSCSPFFSFIFFSLNYSVN